MTNYFVIRNFSDTYSSVEIRKGYMLMFRDAEGIHAHIWECWRGTRPKKGWDPCAIQYKI